MDCQTERRRSLDKGGHISTPLNLTKIVFRNALNGYVGNNRNFPSHPFQKILI